MIKDNLLRKKVDQLLKIRRYSILEEEEKEKENIHDILVARKETDKKLLIRVVLKSYLKSGRAGVRYVRKMKKSLRKRDLKDGILIAKGFSHTARREARNNHIETFSMESLPAFNIFKHVLVPKHEILPREKTKELLKEYHIKTTELPRIRRYDPIAKLIGAKPGDVLKVTRKSPTAGKSISYRYVV